MGEKQSIEKKLPFAIDRDRHVPLISQIVDGVRHAVQTGAYRPGDRLPVFRAIAEELGTCMIVVRAAFSRLAEEGLVCRRRGVGTVIMPTVKTAWRGHIVIASIEVRENHLISAMTGALRQDLMKAGYLVSFVPFGSEPGKFDFTHLESVVRNSVTLVVATSISPEIDRVLAHLKVPYVTFGPSSKAVGMVDFDCSAAVDGFVEYCRKNKAEDIIEITVGSKVATVADALRGAGMRCKSWPIVRRGNIEDISRATIAAFGSKIKREGKSWLPDVLYFNDNFAAQAALTVLLESGVDIPGDVRFVTWSNAGEGPFWRRELTRVEINPFDAGRVFARYVLKYLSGDRAAANAVISPVFVTGET